jgi:glycosyltransferase involved in cell wall biosynthesis
MRIVLSSHSPTLNTGYGRVTRYLSEAIHRAGHELVVAGWGYDSAPHGMPFGLAPIDPFGDHGGQVQAGKLISEINPNVVLSIGDPWMHDQFPDMKEVNRRTWVGYVALDSDPIPGAWKDFIKCMDHPVVFSEWAKNLCDTFDLYPRYIPLGVDTINFRPRSSAGCRRSLGLDEEFIVGCVAKNQTRKNLPALIEAFSAFRTIRGEGKLLLHTPNYSTHGFDVPELLSSFGVSKYTVNTHTEFPAGCGDSMLAQIYNAMDVQVIPSTSEGFCLPVVEAGACHIPTFVTDFGPAPSLVADDFQKMKPAFHMIGTNNLRQAVVEPREILAKLLAVHKDKEMLRTLGHKQMMKARQYDFRDAQRQFANLLDDVTAASGEPRFHLV